MDLDQILLIFYRASSKLTSMNNGSKKLINNNKRNKINGNKKIFIYLIGLLHSSTYFVAAQDSEQQATKEKFKGVHCLTRFSNLNDNGMGTIIQQRLEDHCLAYSINDEFMYKFDDLIKKLYDSPHLFNEVDENPYIPFKISYPHIYEKLFRKGESYSWGSSIGSTRPHYNVCAFKRFNKKIPREI
ncbi:MAG: hypothetical protein K0M45_08100 [Candidatus Paracaedibacteraceae bacterium]|nr:hypothetical protein [Candidatus Paracaedibacteraceae bacterium]